MFLKVIISLSTLPKVATIKLQLFNEFYRKKDITNAFITPLLYLAIILAQNI